MAEKSRLENNITIISTNEQKPNTCGSCTHTDNNLGVVALHCDLIQPDEKHNWGKVRSWDKCHLKPKKYQRRKT